MHWSVAQFKSGHSPVYALFVVVFVCWLVGRWCFDWGRGLGAGGGFCFDGTGRMHFLAYCFLFFTYLLRDLEGEEDTDYLFMICLEDTICS